MDMLFLAAGQNLRSFFVSEALVCMLMRNCHRLPADQVSKIVKAFRRMGMLNELCFSAAHIRSGRRGKLIVCL